MAVAETREQALAAWDRWAPSFGLGEPAAEAGAFVGEPAEIAMRGPGPFLDAGQSITSSSSWLVPGRSPSRWPPRR